MVLVDQFSRIKWITFRLTKSKYFVTILLGLMLCQSSQTLSGLLQQLGNGVSLSGTSHFMGQAPWSAEALADNWQQQFCREMTNQVTAAHAQLRARRKKKRGRGRPKKTVVTGYLIGDDSTMTKLRGKKMGGLGQYYSGTEKKTVTGHSLVQGLYLLLGRRRPLQPEMYRQKCVCEAEVVSFRSKVDIMAEILRTFVPVPDTLTHVLLDSWYTSKRIWKIARERDFLITSGLRWNRSLRIEDETGEKGWRWQHIDEYAATLDAAEWKRVLWPGQQKPRWVYVHVISTRVKKLYRCQLVIVCGQLTEDDQEKTRYWASSDLTADLKTLIGHIATHWEIEVLFADTKEILSLDRYQLMSATAICRFWTLVMLDQERDCQQRETGQHTTIGAVWRQVRAIHWCHFIDWLHQKFRFGLQPADLYQELTRTTL
jgi:hypothetical protein